MTIIRLHHRRPRCSINCSHVPLLVLPLEKLLIQDEAAVHSCADASAITKLERFFIKSGWIPKEA